MHDIGPDEFERCLAVLLSSPPRRFAASVTTHERGIDGLVTSIDAHAPSAVIYHRAGSGKSHSYVWQAKHSNGGFSASARQLARAGVRTEMLRYYLASQLFTEAHSSGGARTTALIVQSGPDSSSVCWSPVALPDCRVATPSAAGGSATRIERLRDALRSFPRSRPVMLVQRATDLELFNVMSRLAAKARSRWGVLSGPPPTAPPGQIVRTHPLVPRGPSAAPRTVTIWPPGGVPSLA